jgi:peptide/nickel transport system permease protein
MKRSTSIFLGIAFAIVTLVQWDLISAGIISFVTSPVILVSSSHVLGPHWSNGLLPYWVAAVTWICVGLWLLWTMFRSVSAGRQPATHRLSSSNKTIGYSRSGLLLGIMVIAAATSPFITPVDPDTQGNLVTTRLLPPLSTGYVREYVTPFDSQRTNSFLESAFVTSRRFLLGRRIVMSGIQSNLEANGSFGKMKMIRDSRIVFLFGTDDNGRDVFSRIIAGTRISLGIGICAALGALLIGGSVGFLSGMNAGIIDATLMRFTDLFLSIPGLFLVIGILAFVGQSVFSLIAVLSISGWMGIARIIRGEVVSLRDREFILAARMLRVSPWKIATRHLLPNLAPILVTSVVLQFANAIVGEAALGFLGLGLQPPTATWGNMMGEATRYLGSGWWVGVFPGVVLSILLVLVHSFAERSFLQKVGTTRMMLP